MHAFYLHGFASSARSTKAVYFAERLAEHRVLLHRPDFNEPEFETLTMTRMLDQLEREIASVSAAPVALIGSSLGGTLAILAADRLRSCVDRLVLFAPAVMFARPGHHLLPPERVDRWRLEGTLPFFHHAFGGERLLNFTFYEDTVRYDAFAATFDQPTLVFQGLRDRSVDYRTVEAFADRRPNVTLTLVEDDHQLAVSLPGMWSAIRPFLGLAA